LPALNEAERIQLRGQLATFKTSFYSDAAFTVPLIPLDAGIYPAFTIFNPSNMAMQSGVGSPEALPGQYKAEYLVPGDAVLSNDLARWRIEWLMVTEDNRQLNFVEEFDVRDTIITASTHREQKYITLAGKDARTMIRLAKIPVDLSLDVNIGASDAKIVDNVTLAANQIKYVADGDGFVFYYDIPGALVLANTSYVSVWMIRQTVGDIGQFTFQTITSVNANIMNLIASVRILIDKFQKRLGTYQAYEDSDIVEYLQRGQELINATYPSTYYMFGLLPSALTVFHVLAASVYGLTAQQLLETDLGVSFSGQTVTFDYDHSSQIADVIGRWQEFINTQLPAAKTSITRRTSSVGTVANRAYRFTDPNLFTYKIAGYSGVGTGSIMGQLTTLGLIF